MITREISSKKACISSVGMRRGRKQPVMKVIIALTLAALLQVVDSRAADVRTFEGVNLEEWGQTQRLRDMPEIYERPANEPRFRMLKAVVQIPLNGAWISFNAETNVFYLNKVPGENAATYFGPIGGDAFEVFKLEEKFIAALRKEYLRMLSIGSPSWCARATKRCASAHCAS